jgi:hypothetical protein
MGFTNPFSTPTTPGVAGPAQAGQPVVYDPSTGLYVNQATGAVSTDPGGQHPVANPSLATQAARNIAVSNQLMAKLATYGNNFNQAYQGQVGLQQQLQRTIQGTGGPSVAEGQLVAGLGQVRSTENSEAAGATGANAALARQNAQLATGQAETETNQQAAQLRAQEVNQAQQTEAGVLGSEASENANLYGTNLQGATAASGQAGSEEGQKESADEAGQASQNALELNIINGIGQAAAKGGAGGAGAAPVTSDPKAKTDVTKLHDAALKQFTDKLAGYGFHYRDPGRAGEAPGNRVGVMADQVQKGGPLGKSAVIAGKTLKLDVPNALGAALAAIGYLSRQIKARKAA